MSCKTIILSFFAFLFILASIALTGFHTKPLCKSTGENWEACTQSIKNSCAPGLGLSFETISNGQTVDNWVFCNWKERTYLTAFISLALSVAFLFLFGICVCGRVLRSCGFFVGSVAVAGLLTGTAFMIVDIIKGHHQFDNDTGAKYIPDTYIANVVLLGVTALLVCVTSIAVHGKSRREYQEKV